METTPDELRKAALAAHGREDVREARNLFEQLVGSFPASPYVKEALQYLRDHPIDGTHSRAKPEVQLVRVVEFDVGFVNLVWLFVKAAFAAIPAAIIVTVIYFVALSVLSGALRSVAP